MPLVKSRDKSRKFVRCWFACDVILSLSLLNMCVRSLRALSLSLPDLVLITAKPSSR